MAEILDGAPAQAAPADGTDDFGAPLGYAQERAHLLRSIFPDRLPGNFSRALELTGELDSGALSAALSAVAARHAALRSRHVGGPVVPRQVFDAPWTLRCTDLSASGAAAAASALAAARAAAAAPLDRWSGGPCRALLLRIRPDRHLLVLVLDAALMDEDGFGVLWREVADTYAGREPAGPAADFAEYVAGERTTAYWRPGTDPVRLPATELPHDRVAPRTGARGVRRFTLDGPILARAREFAAAHGVGTDLVGLAALAALLGRYCRTRQVVLGVAVPERSAAPRPAEPPGAPDGTGRTAPAAGRPLGVLREPLPVALDLTGDPTFAELTDRVARTVRTPPWSVRPPLGALIERLDPPRDLGRPPLFQLSYTAGGDRELTLPGCVVRQIDLPGGAIETDLAVTARMRKEQWCWSVDYAAALFEERTAARLATEYGRLLTQCLAAPAAPVSRPARPVPPPAARRVPSCEPLTAALRTVARRDPAARAVSLDGQRLDHRTLDLWSGAIARRLADRGVGAEVRVGVVARRTPAAVAVLLGILKAGGAFVPLPAAAAGAEPPPGPALVLDPDDTDDPLIAPPAAGTAPDGPPAPLPRPVAESEPDTLLACYRTSGSTGTAKTIATTHRGLQHYRDYLRDVIGLSSSDVVLQIASLTFDASLRDLLCPLAAGAAVELLPDDCARDPAGILAAIARAGVTAILAVVPSLLAAVVEAATAPAPTLRLVAVSGEPLTAALAARVRRWAPYARLVNQFGLTECTMTSTYHEVGDEDLARGVIPIGRPIPGTRAHVLDADGETLPPGALGELHLAGPGLNRGYTRPGPTAERYVPDPFGPPGSRLFRTGDLARVTDDGTLLHHGRSDDQVKVRGVRVELDECEAALWRCPGVRAAAVALRDGDLVAYLVGDATGSRVRRHLAERLPAAMVPNHYVPMAALPFTANGKVDRRSLPGPRAARGQQPPTAPRDAAELRLRACWQDVLDREHFGVDDDFFALGGTSRTALELVHLVRERLGADLPAARVFAAPTIEDLCADESLADPPAAGLLLRLRRGEPGRPPVILLPDATGGAARYQPLADEIRDGSPVLAAEAVGRARGERPLDRIGAMASACLAALRTAGPAKPAVLLGWGTGARVALALGGLLEDAATPPRLIVAVHPDTPDTPDATGVHRYAALCGLPALGALDDRAALAALLRLEKKRSHLPPRADTATMRRLLAVFAAAQAAEAAAAEAEKTAGPAPARTPVLHVRGTAAPGAPPTDRDRDGRHLVLPVALGAVPGADALAAVGSLLERELRGAAC